MAFRRGLAGRASPTPSARPRRVGGRGGAPGSRQPRPSTPAEVELTYYVKQAIAPEGTHTLALHVYARRRPPRRPLLRPVRRVAPRRRVDAAGARPGVVAPTSARESLVEGKGVSRATAGARARSRSSPRTRRASPARGRRRLRRRPRPGGRRLLNASVADLGDGSTRLLHARSPASTARGEPARQAVGDALYRVHVLPAATSPPTMPPSGRGCRGGRRRGGRFLITPRDSFGNPRLLEPPTSSRRAYARRGGEAAASPSASRLVWQKAAVTDLHNGPSPPSTPPKRARTRCSSVVHVRARRSR